MAVSVESARYLELKKFHREACTKHARFENLAYFLDAQSRCGAVRRDWRHRRFALIAFYTI